MKHFSRAMTLALFRVFLVILSFVYGSLFVRDVTVSLTKPDRLIQTDRGHPVGGDFINFFSAGKLAAEGRVAEIYDPAAFADFQRTIIPAHTGLRLWAYPPTSLLLAAPFGLMGFWAALGVWSALGLATLVIGARRIGLSWLDASLVALSPAALTCILHGQTGNLAIGLLLIALSARTKLDVNSALAAAVLTTKPQLGFMLPVLWVIQRRPRLVVAATVLTIVLVGAATLVFGLQGWADYLTKTLPALEHLERAGDGPFLAMIPSIFISLRIVTQNAELATAVHLAFAALVFIGVTIRCMQMRDPLQQASAVLIATALITPYIHIYDLAGVFCALLIHGTRHDAFSLTAGLVAALATLVAWAMPLITVFGNVVLIPLGPPVLLALLAVVSWRVRPAESTARGLSNLP